jgi:hypothetical protein
MMPSSLNLPDNPTLRALHFDEATLQENRLGRMTPMQRNTFGGRLTVMGIGVLILVVPMVCIFSWVGGSLPAGLAWTAVIGVILGAITAVWVGSLVKKMLNDFREARVETTAGTVHIEKTGNMGTNRNIQYWAVVNGNERFPIDLQIKQALIEGQYYRLYYAPHTRFVMGVETV